MQIQFCKLDGPVRDLEDKTEEEAIFLYIFGYFCDKKVPRSGRLSFGSIPQSTLQLPGF